MKYIKWNECKFSHEKNIPFSHITKNYLLYFRIVTVFCFSSHTTTNVQQQHKSILNNVCVRNVVFIQTKVLFCYVFLVENKKKTRQNFVLARFACMQKCSFDFIYLLDSTFICIWLNLVSNSLTNNIKLLTYFWFFLCVSLSCALALMNEKQKKMTKVS